VLIEPLTLVLFAALCCGYRHVLCAYVDKADFSCLFFIGGHMARRWETVASPKLQLLNPSPCYLLQKFAANVRYTGVLLLKETDF